MLRWVLWALVLSFASVSWAESLRVDPQSVPVELRNAWPAEWEQGFRARAEHSLALLAARKKGGTTWGESEKRLYPLAFAHVLAGDRAWGLKQLQAKDAEDIHSHTHGIDLFWTFTLKGQARKFFAFAPLLEADYQQRLRDAADAWTQSDPAATPHPQFGKGDRSVKGWGPQAKGFCVDRRDTDNLRLMRDTTVYLLAEAAGNEPVRVKAKQRLEQFARMLYHVGQREWDSETYLGHSMVPLLNLYDFAQDREVRLIAKGCLDWMTAAAAVKYYRGGIGGPVLRDYGSANVVFGAGLSHPMWLYFGDTPQNDPQPHVDDVYFIMSGYRPPAAVVALARKQFDRPVELLASKPAYRLWRGEERDPEVLPRFFETTTFGPGWQMGSVISAEAETTWDCNPFKLLVRSDTRGVDVFVANTTPLWGHAGKNAGDQIVQWGGLLIWLTKAAPDTRMHYMVPGGVALPTDAKTWRVPMGQATVVVHPIGHTWQPAEIQGKAQERVTKVYPEELFVQGVPTKDAAYVGFALEVVGGDARPSSELDLSALERGRVTVKDATRSLTLMYHAENDVPGVERDGEPYDPTAGRDVYLSRAMVIGDTEESSAGPIRQDWLSGTLEVRAGDLAFVGKCDAAGYRFENRVGDDER